MDEEIHAYWRRQLQATQAGHEGLVAGLRDEISRLQSRCHDLAVDQTLHRASFCFEVRAAAIRFAEESSNPGRGRGARGMRVPLLPFLSCLHQLSGGLISPEYRPGAKRTRETDDQTQALVAASAAGPETGVATVSSPAPGGRGSVGLGAGFGQVSPQPSFPQSANASASPPLRPVGGPGSIVNTAAAASFAPAVFDFACIRNSAAPAAAPRQLRPQPTVDNTAQVATAVSPSDNGGVSGVLDAAVSQLVPTTAPTQVPPPPQPCASTGSTGVASPAVGGGVGAVLSSDDDDEAVHSPTTTASRHRHRMAATCAAPPTGSAEDSAAVQPVALTAVSPPPPMAVAPTRSGGLALGWVRQQHPHVKRARDFDDDSPLVDDNDDDNGFAVLGDAMKAAAQAQQEFAAAVAHQRGVPAIGDDSVGGGVTRGAA